MQEVSIINCKKTAINESGEGSVTGPREGEDCLTTHDHIRVGQHQAEFERIKTSLWGSLHARPGDEHVISPALLFSTSAEEETEAERL